LDVQHRPADDQRHRPAAEDGLDVVGGGTLIAADRRGLGDVEHVELVMRNPAPLGNRQFRGADVHPAVELHGVGVDDLTAEPFGQVQRQGTLARPGRPDDGDGASRHCSADPGRHASTVYPTP